MKNAKYPEQIDLLPYIGKWLVLSLIVAVLAGTASAFFLFSLEWATAWREAHGWIIRLLPVAGFAVGWIYLRFGKNVEAGNNLLIDEIHDPKKMIPLRMAPLVLGGTVISHLFGTSVGREGTAVQMGGALADQLTHVFRMDHRPAAVSKAAKSRRCSISAPHWVMRWRRCCTCRSQRWQPRFCRSLRRSRQHTDCIDHHAIELFGPAIGPYAGIACVVSYLFSGHTASIARNA